MYNYISFFFKLYYNDDGDIMHIKVLVEISSKKLDKTFIYEVPSILEDKMKIGIRVLVPFSNRKLEGFVMEIGFYNVDYKLKKIISVIDLNPVLTDEMILIGKYMSKKTLSTLISCYQTMLPKALKAQNKTKISKKYEVYSILLNKKYNAKNKLQQRIIDEVKQCEIKKKNLVSISISAYKTLLKHGVIGEVKKEVYRLSLDNFKSLNEIVLSKDQQQVVDKVLNCRTQFKPFLLYGVTGSGKTEVYMNIIKKIIEQKEVIVLVPEISLTPQFVELFKNRFGSNIAIMHSGLSDGERYDEYRKVSEGKVKIVIGARSAIFSPFKNLGLIIIDEEHTDTYKQDNSPRYDAIDIALKRAKYHNIPLLLGSATPSIESYTRAKLGVYELLELKNRINKSLPVVKLVDMKEEIKNGYKILSRILIEEIKNCIEKDQQVLLLLNRRGYKTTVTCNNCGYIAKCPNCDISLVYHKTQNKMNCHYCNYTSSKMIECPSCHSKDIISFGLGTEKLQEEVEKIFSVPVLRMDVDTTVRKGSHEKILRAFKEKKASILVGTQMIAKGLDFENVTLVGVINGDASLNIPDYRSAERTFDLLNQVAGRSGRGKLKGNVIIQGFNLDHYSIKYASQHDYVSFYNAELKIRKMLNYPPYTDLTLIKVVGNDYDICYKEAIKIKTFLLKYNIKVLGPSDSNVSKINNKYYIQIILKYKKLKNIYKYLLLIKDMYTDSKINIDIDISPKRI